eukprot:3902801-Pleurochrysis_carterae.AAC.1
MAHDVSDADEPPLQGGSHIMPDSDMRAVIVVKDHAECLPDRRLRERAACQPCFNVGKTIRRYLLQQCLPRCLRKQQGNVAYHVFGPREAGSLEDSRKLSL